MARRRWSEWASARMLRALVREGARVHAAAGVHGLWHHLCSSLRVAGRGCPKSAFAGGVPAFFGPIPRVTTPRIKLTYCICFSAKSLKHVWVFITRLDKMKESCSEPHI
jgi:hypothetical protein